MAQQDSIDLFGFKILNERQADAIERLLNGTKRRTAAFLNAHCINLAVRSRRYADALKRADVLLPDGSGLQCAARMTGRRFVENLNGTDLFPVLCQAASARGRSMYFLGAAPGIAEAAASAACALAPGLSIAGAEDGFFEADETDAVIERINASGADILLVAMGVPRQELWIDQHRDRLAPRLAIGVGAQFDFWSGRIARAPIGLRRVGLEWVWRLALEPRRLFGRYVLGNPAFLVRAALHALRWRAARFDGGRLGKRALDLAIAGAALIALAPFFLLVALAIKLDSRGPVFFRQTRVGQDGRRFQIFKLRSMHVDAEARRADLLSQSDRAGVCFKAKRDPRITRVGRLLRRFSLDELPQLINVVRGEMSIVGPRPALPEEVAAYPTAALERLSVPPGITGLWQVSGRADIGFDKMIDMDVAYARSRSVLLDLVLIALTARAVLGGRGAY